MNNSGKIDIMGIVNLTEDSFYGRSRCSGVDAALSRISSMLEDGADIIDIGACSTRPGALPVDADEEWRRLAPLFCEMPDAFPGVRISVDTFRSSVVTRTYDLIGDFIVNDITAGEEDEMMLDTVGALGLEYIAMHRLGSVVSMHHEGRYEDLVSDVLDFFRSFSRRAAAAGVRNWILDPGFGFSKSVEQNWELFRSLDRLKEICDEEGNSRKLLVGVSRKSMIYKLLGVTPEQSLSATQVVHLAALQKGADILRVHDVAESVRTVRLYNALNQKEFPDL